MSFDKHIPLVFDAHCDSLILREVREDPLDLAPACPRYHVDLPRMRRGNLQAAWIMAGDSNLAQSLRLIDAVHGMAAAHPADFALCATAEEVRAAREHGQAALLLSIEGQSMFAERMEGVRNWHRLGVRMFSLTHGEGKFGGGANAPHALQHDSSFFGYLTPRERETLARQHKGLTPFARESIGEISRLGAILDLAHCNDTAFWEALECACGPVCFSHGNCYRLCPHARNLTDEMMTALARHGGVLGLCLWGPFIDQQDATLDRFCDHVLHALEVMGPAHVALGTDFDGVNLHQTCVIEDAAGLPRLWDALAKRGVSEADLRNIASENMLRLCS
jgi:membrane dipeptidase